MVVMESVEQLVTSSVVCRVSSVTPAPDSNSLLLVEINQHLDHLPVHESAMERPVVVMDVEDHVVHAEEEALATLSHHNAFAYLKHHAKLNEKHVVPSLMDATQ